MKNKILHTESRPTVPARWMGIAALTFVLGSISHATLGGPLDSVQADQAQMKATIAIHQASLFTVHEMRAATGTTVREYVSLSGQVFGVAWQGPFIPDMRQILGTYFVQYSLAAKAQRESRVGRRPLNIQDFGLVVQTSGHMRSFAGRAYDPELLPAGVNADVIR